jgi:endonuclease/exonuclease/phosphatase (EEP) superfamily protein YafD
MAIMKAKILRLLNFFSLIAIASTALSFFSHDFYLADILSNFRFQYFLYLFVISIVNFIFTKKILGAIAFIFCLVNLYFFLPLMSKTQALNKPIKIFYANVLSQNKNYRGLINQIEKEDPHIIGLLEINSSWASALAPIMAKYPHMIIIPQEDNFGLALYSKEEFLDVEEIKSEMGLSSIVASFADYQLFLTHPYPPISSDSWKSRNSHYQEIVKKFKGSSSPLILIGDFNSAPWSVHLQEMSESLELNLVNGLQCTWPTHFPPGFRLGLDHAFVSKNIKASKRILNAFGSDHLPFLLEIEP